MKNITFFNQMTKRIIIRQSNLNFCLWQSFAFIFSSVWHIFMQPNIFNLIDYYSNIYIFNYSCYHQRFFCGYNNDIFIYSMNVNVEAKHMNSVAIKICLLILLSMGFKRYRSEKITRKLIYSCVVLL